MTDDLIAFVTARLDEDEALVNKVYGFWRGSEDGNIVDISYGSYIAVGPQGEGIDGDSRDYILRYGPERALREVAAKRAMLAELERAKAFSDHMFSSAHPEGVASGEVLGQRTRAAAQVLILERVAMILATAWSDHPDYRAEWAPDASSSR